MNSYFIELGFFRKKLFGPLSEEGVWNLIAAGTIQAKTRCRFVSDTQWRKVSDYFQLPALAKPGRGLNMLASGVEAFGKIFGVALALLVVLVIFAVGSRDKDAPRVAPAASAPMTDLQKFWFAATAAVREHLDNPDAAVFCGANDPQAETLSTTNNQNGEGAAMRGWVKEKRPDGTWRRLAWGACIAHDEEGFRALGCQINEREFGIYKHAGR